MKNLSPGSATPASVDLSAALLRVATPSKIQPIDTKICRYNRYADNASDIEVPPAASLQCHSRCQLSIITCLNRKPVQLFLS